MTTVHVNAVVIRPVQGIWTRYVRSVADAALARRLAVAGSVLVASFLGLVLVLAVLPDNSSVVSKTLSTDVYSRYWVLVRLSLLLFGIGALAVAGALALRLQGRAGRFSAGLCAAWATASFIDAIVSTSPPGRHTTEGLVHIGLALVGLAAQMLLAAAYPLMLRRRTHQISVPAAMTTALVLAAGTFFLLHARSQAGLGERILFATSALWMVVNVHLAGTSAPRAGLLASSAGPAPATRTAASTSTQTPPDETPAHRELPDRVSP